MKTHSVGLIAVAVLASALAVLGAIHLVLIDGLDGWLWGLLPGEDTVYSPGYSNAAFRRVHRGMTVEQVHALLGPPHDRWYPPWTKDGIEFGERWSYSPGDTNYRSRVVLFGKGRVLRKHAEFYMD